MANTLLQEILSSQKNISKTEGYTLFQSWLGTGWLEINVLMYAVFTVFPLFSPCGKFHLQSRTQRKRIRARSNENESSELQPLLDVFHRPTPIHSLQHSSSLDPAFRPRPVKKNKPQQLKHYPPP